MSANSKIEWTDHTFNPWIGCTKVSPGCAHCYAEGESKRRGWAKWGKGQPRHRTSENYWKQPLKWNNTRIREGDYIPFAARTYRRPRVFCASLADWLDDEVPIEWLADLLALIHATPNLDWQLLTKRPENLFARLWQVLDSIYTAEKAVAASEDDEEEERQILLHDFVFNWLEGYAPSNVWIGTSVEDQERADERIPELLKIPAVVRFLSCEPLLGPVDISRWRGFHWVICGGESGPHARPMHPDWARSLRDQCNAIGATFFFKQWGEYLHEEIFAAEQHRGALRIAELCFAAKRRIVGVDKYFWIGKHRAGRLLDGREWNEMPQGAIVAHA